jgi:hypothetical protein
VSLTFYALKIANKFGEICPCLAPSSSFFLSHAIGFATALSAIANYNDNFKVIA